MYSVEVSNNGDYFFNVKSKDYQCAIDIKGKGMTPPDVLLAALGSCIGVYVRKYAQGANLQLDAFAIKVSAEFSKEPPVAFKAINVTIDLQKTKLDERRKIALLEFVRNCPVHNTLKASPQVEIALT